MRKPTINKSLNFLLYITFCAMTGTGLLLAFRLLPGSQGGHGLEALGLSRHDWGDIHTWLAYGFITLIVAHLAMHWRWLWQAAAKKRYWPLLGGLACGIAIILLIVFQPINRNDNEQRGRAHANTQPSGQKPGCGQPVMQLLGVFDLGSGALLGWEKSPWNIHEASLFETAVMPQVRAGDVLVGDRAYDAYRHYALLQMRGAEAVVRLHKRRACPL